MQYKFDHVVIGVTNLDQAAADYREQGFSVYLGGEHASGTTHNALVVLRDGSYLELMAKTGKTAKPNTDGMDFAPLLKEKEGFVAYALYVEDLEGAVKAMRERGVTVDDPHPGKRTRKDGVELRWKLVMLEVGTFKLILISDETERTLRIPNTEPNATHSNHATGVTSVLHVADDPKAHAERLQAILGVAPTYHQEQPTFTLDDLTINVMKPQTDLLKTYHDAHGDSIWRVVLSGIGDMYKRLDTEKLHNAQMIIVGEKD